MVVVSPVRSLLSVPHLRRVLFITVALVCFAGAFFAMVGGLVEIDVFSKVLKVISALADSQCLPWMPTTYVRHYSTSFYTNFEINLGAVFWQWRAGTIPHNLCTDVRTDVPVPIH